MLKHYKLHLQLMWEYLACKFEGWCKYFSPIKLVSLWKLAPSRNIFCTGTSSVRMAWTLSLKYLIKSFCKTLIVDEKMLILAIDRGWKSDKEIIYFEVSVFKLHVHGVKCTLIIFDYS